MSLFRKLLGVPKAASTASRKRGIVYGPPIPIEYLVIAGGGGAGNSGTSGGGGAGAGGYRTASGLEILGKFSYTVTVGAGGTAGYYDSPRPGNGSDSVFHTITSTGGGKGGILTGTGSNAGGSGGSGGGAPGNNPGAGAGNAGGYSPVEGYAGGASSGSIRVAFKIKI